MGRYNSLVKSKAALLFSTPRSQLFRVGLIFRTLNLPNGSCSEQPDHRKLPAQIDSITAMPSSRIAELASVIQIETSRVDEFFSSQGIPAPSFDVDAPLGFVLPDDIAASREIILEATDELHSLMQGPIELLNIQSV